MEATQANATAREKVLIIVNSMTLDPLQLSLYSSNLLVAWLTLSLSSRAAADVSD